MPGLRNAEQGYLSYQNFIRRSVMMYSNVRFFSGAKHVGKHLLRNLLFARYLLQLSRECDKDVQVS